VDIGLRSRGDFQLSGSHCKNENAML
jgi:hypothetical protein